MDGRGAARRRPRTPLQGPPRRVPFTYDGPGHTTNRRHARNLSISRPTCAPMGTVSFTVTPLAEGTEREGRDPRKGQSLVCVPRGSESGRPRREARRPRTTPPGSHGMAEGLDRTGACVHVCVRRHVRDKEGPGGPGRGADPGTRTPAAGVALTTTVEPTDRTLRARKGEDGPHGLSSATAP